MIPILGIPILNRGDLLERLIESIDYPVELLYIVDNSEGKDDSVREVVETLNVEHEFIQRVDIARTEHNLGVAGSWNHIMSVMQDKGLSYSLIVGNDMMFNPGELEKIDTFVKANAHDHVIMFAHAYNAFAVTPLNLKIVGTFDENIYPAYLEDCDHFYRVTLAGAKSVNIPNVSPLHGEAPSFGSSTIYSNRKWRELNGTTHGNNFLYYRRKWGGNNGEEKFVNPFNDLTKDLKYWEFDPEWRKQQDIWI